MRRMVKRSSLDPIEEARARVRLRYAKAKPVHPGPPTIGKALQKIARKTLPNSGAAIDRLKDEWEAIVGPQLAKLCRPEKITASKKQRTLTLRVIPAAAGLVQHQTEIIRQRVSVAAGGDITKLKIVQGALTANRFSDANSPHVPLNADQKQALIDSAQEIEDKELRKAIVALGEAVLTASKR